MVSHFDLGNTRIDAVDGVVHGSALLVRFLKIAEMHGLKTWIICILSQVLTRKHNYLLEVVIIKFNHRHQKVFDWRCKEIQVSETEETTPEIAEETVAEQQIESVDTPPNLQEHPGLRDLVRGFLLY